MHQIGVVAHTSRATQATTLATTVGGAVLSLDDGSLGCEGNHRAVWEDLASLPADWSVILEDDAAPIPGFAEQLAAALPMAPSPLVSLYLGRQRPAPWMPRVQRALAAAEKTGAHWIVSTTLLHAVGYAIKTELLASLLRQPVTAPVDRALLTRWARSHGHLVSYTVGSLVEHTDLPTTVEHPDGQPRQPGRRAWRLGGHDQWNTRTVTLQ